MKRLYLVTLPERVWHWLNAVVFITLILSGFLMHGVQNLRHISLGSLILIHNVAAFVFIAELIFWFGYQLVTGRIRHYLRVERDIQWRLIRQAKFYLYGIFRGHGHPYEAEADSKFNPLQRLTYLGLMFGLLPAQILTGAVMWGFSKRVEWLTDLPLFRVIALAHTALAFGLLAFLIGHIYLATTGSGPFALVKTMITGWHEEK